MPNLIPLPQPVDCLHCMTQGDDCSRSLGPYAKKGSLKKVPCVTCGGKGYLRPPDILYWPMKVFKIANDKRQAEEDRYMHKIEKQRKKLIASAMGKLTADEIRALGIIHD